MQSVEAPDATCRWTSASSGPRTASARVTSASRLLLRRQAKGAALNALAFAGHADWRVPNVNELQSLANYGGGFTSATYWSSSGTASHPPYVWTVAFHDGSVTTFVKGNHRADRSRLLRTAAPCKGSPAQTSRIAPAGRRGIGLEWTRLTLFA